jgi:hypothetical protein
MKTIFLFYIVLNLILSQESTINVHVRNTKKSKFMFTLFQKIVKIHEKRTGEKFILNKVHSSAKRMIRILEKKENPNKTVCSFGITISKNKYTNKYYAFSKPIFPVYNSVIALKSTKEKSSHIFDKIGYVYKKGGNSYYYKLTKKLAANGYKFQNPVFIDKYTNLIPTLRSKKVDFIIADSIDGWLNEDIKVVAELDKEPQFLAFLYEKNSVLKEKFDNIFKYYLKSPAFYKLLEEHFGKNFRKYYLKTMNLAN